MATTEDPEVDDRWSSFKDPNKNSTLGSSNSKEPVPTLTDYLAKVLLQRSPTDRQERKYKMACTLVKEVTDVAWALSAEWQAYIPSDNHMGVRTTPLRTLSEDMYDSMVSLIRPMRLDAFKIVQRGVDEMPQHRCLIQVNPALCRQEQQLVYNQWDPFINKKGYLKAGAVLIWFNTGLNKACSTLLKQSHSVDKLFCTVGEDGTAILHATTTEFIEGELFIDTFTVNIFPVFVIDKLPPSLKLTAPLPCFGPYIHGQKAFRELVLKDLEDGKHIAFLDPKTEPCAGAIRRCLSKEGPSWKLNLSFTEYHVYSLIDRYCRGLNFRHVLVLLNILREENSDTLKILNNDILVNTLFVVSQKYIDKLRSKQDWIFQMFGNLINGLRLGFLPSFHLPRMNLLALYNITESESAYAAEVLNDIRQALRENPENLYNYTGYIDRQSTERDEEAYKKIDTEKRDVQMTGIPEEEVTPDDRPMSLKETTLPYEESSTQVYSALMANTGETSDISKFSRRAERSDIY